MELQPHSGLTINPIVSGSRSMATHSFTRSRHSAEALPGPIGAGRSAPVIGVALKAQLV